MAQQNAETKNMIVKIKKFMFANNLSQKDIGDSGIISREFLNLVLNGKKNMSDRMIYKIEKYMNNYENQNSQ